MEDGTAKIGDRVAKGYTEYAVVATPHNGILYGMTDAGEMVMLAECEVYLLKPPAD